MAQYWLTSQIYKQPKRKEQAETVNLYPVAGFTIFCLLSDTNTFTLRYFSRVPIASRRHHEWDPPINLWFSTKSSIIHGSQLINAKIAPCKTDVTSITNLRLETQILLRMYVYFMRKIDTKKIYVVQNAHFHVDLFRNFLKGLFLLSLFCSSAVYMFVPCTI